MAKAKTAAPNPFGAAKTKAPAGVSKKDDEAIVAQDFTSYSGDKFSKDDTTEAIHNFCEGSSLYKSGESMMKSSRPVILHLARTMFAKRWLSLGKRPSNPLVSTDPGGRGDRLKVVFQDRATKLNDESYAALANLIGAEAAEVSTLKQDEFQINSELLHQEVDVKRDGKVVKQTVMEAIAEALQEKFAPSPEILAELFEVNHRFETQKGLIDKGLQLVAQGSSDSVAATKLAEFLVVGNFTTQLKPGSS